MDSQEHQGWDIAKERTADFQREAAQRHLAASIGGSGPIVMRLRLVVPLLFSLAGVLAWLVVR
jgi:hypothetical protein